MKTNQNINAGSRILTPPGSPAVGTIGQLYPLNAANRPNPIGGVNLENGLGSFGLTMNQGLEKQLSDMRIMSETFEPHIASRGNDGHRSIFTKVMIPKHKQTLVMGFTKSTGMDESPMTAAVTGITGWNPKWNEAAISASSVEITTNIYGRFYKKHRFADDISLLSWFQEMGEYFKTNATRTLENLASIRLWEGSNRLFVSDSAKYDPANPYASRITCVADASAVNANLTWDMLKEAKYQMENYQETYNIVNQDTGAITQKTRTARIAGHFGNDYLVLVGSNGYRQLLADPETRESYVINGGYAAQQISEETYGIVSAVNHLRIQILDNPLTISKAALPVPDTTGKGDLEVAYVIGGNNGARVAIELSLEGWTRMINIDYTDSPKLDPFALMAVIGYTAAIDFAVIRNEAIIAIPYLKMTNLSTNQGIVAPTSPKWRK